MIIRVMAGSLSLRVVLPGQLLLALLPGPGLLFLPLPAPGVRPGPTPAQGSRHERKRHRGIQDSHQVRRLRVRLSLVAYIITSVVIKLPFLDSAFPTSASNSLARTAE